MKLAIILLLGLGCVSCPDLAGRGQGENLSGLGFCAARAGALTVSDEDLRDIDVDTVPSVAIEGGTRFGPGGHLSISSGLNVQWDKAETGMWSGWFPPQIIPVEMDVVAASVPVIFGVNSTSTAKFLDGVPNLFAGVGGVAYMVHADRPIDDSEFGVGALFNIAVQFPAPEYNMYFTVDVRYSYKPIDDDAWDPVGNIGGFEISAGIGFFF